MIINYKFLFVLNLVKNKHVNELLEQQMLWNISINGLGMLTFILT